MKKSILFLQCNSAEGHGRITFCSTSIGIGLSRAADKIISKFVFLCTYWNNRQFRGVRGGCLQEQFHSYTECAAISQPLSAPARRKGMSVRQSRLTRVTYQKASFVFTGITSCWAHFSPSIFGPTARRISAPPNTTRLSRDLQTIPFRLAVELGRYFCQRVGRHDSIGAGSTSSPVAGSLSASVCTSSRSPYCTAASGVEHGVLRRHREHTATSPNWRSPSMSTTGSKRALRHRGGGDVDRDAGLADAALGGEHRRSGDRARRCAVAGVWARVVAAPASSSPTRSTDWCRLASPPMTIASRAPARRPAGARRSRARTRRTRPPASCANWSPGARAGTDRTGEPRAEPPATVGRVGFSC